MGKGSRQRAKRQGESSGRVFVSYAWGDEAEKTWVRNLVVRLQGDGVDVDLDTFAVRPGHELSFFMEGIARADRILMVATPDYVRKADDRDSGVGFEARLISSVILRNLMDNIVVPVLRRGTDLPVAMGSAKYIDFREHSSYERSYRELLRELRGEHIAPGEGSLPSSSRANTRSVKCYVEEYTNDAGLPSVRIREKKTDRRVGINVTTPEQKAHFLQFLNAIATMKSMFSDIFDRENDDTCVLVTGEVDFDSDDEIRFVNNHSLTYLVS